MTVPQPSDEQVKRTTEILDVLEKAFGDLMTGDPSAPTKPARSIAKRTGRFWIATSWTTWS